MVRKTHAHWAHFNDFIHSAQPPVSAPITSLTFVHILARTFLSFPLPAGRLQLDQPRLRPIFWKALLWAKVVLLIEFLSRAATGAKGWHREEAHQQVQDGRSPEQFLIVIRAGWRNDNLILPQEKPLRVTNNHANETLKMRLG